MQTEEREGIRRWFRREPNAILTNVMIYSEGVDEPSIEVIAMAAPTKSKTKFAQMLGRGSRLAEGSYDIEESRKLGKTHVILLDVTDNTSNIGSEAVNIAELVDAPLKRREMNGTPLTEEIEVQKAIVRTKRAEEEVEETVAKRAKLFKKKTSTGMVWKNAEPNLFHLMTDELSFRVRLQGRNWVAEFWSMEKGFWEGLRQPSWKSLKKALEYVEGGVRQVCDKPWRYEAPSPRQLGFSKMTRYRTPYDRIVVEPGDTKGSMAEKITGWQKRNGELKRVHQRHAGAMAV